MRMEVKSNRNVVYRCTYHVVWCPKFRRKVLVDDPQRGNVATRLKDLIAEVCTDLDADVIELEVMPDHVHLVVGCDPQFGIHRLVKRIKGRTSHDLRAEFPNLRSKLPTLWTNSYFVSTVGGAPLEALKEYVRSQKNV